MTYKVTLYHPVHSYLNARIEVKKWAKLHCKSYDDDSLQSLRELDMKHVEGLPCFRKDYWFKNEEDAVLFSLRWS